MARADNALNAVALERLTVALFIVVVPVVAPILTLVAAPPMLRVVALVLNTVAVPVPVVVISEPLTAISPEVVMFPELPAMEKKVPLTSLAPKARAVAILLSDRSIPVVIAPPADVTFMPEVRASLVSALFIKRS